MNNKKKYAVTKLIIIAVFVAIGLFMTIFAFNIPKTADKFLSFIGAMKTSTEISSSYRVEMTVDTSENGLSNDEVNESVKVIDEILSMYTSDYSDIKIMRGYGENNDEKIFVNVPAESGLNETFLKLFAEPQKFEAKKDSDVMITNKNIEVAQYMQYQGKYGVVLNFDTDGVNALLKYEDTLTFNINEEQVTGENINGSLFLTSTDISDANNASKTAVALMMGKIPCKLKVETHAIDALAGENVKTILKITSIIVAVLYICYMLLAHKMLGLVQLLSAGAYVIVDCFIIQSAPIASLQLASYFAILLAFVLYVIANEYQIAKIKGYASNGKSMKYSVKNGYKDSLFTLMDLHIVSFVVSICALIMGSRIIKAFSINMIIGIVISALLVFVVNKFLTNLLVNACGKKSLDKKFNFKIIKVEKLNNEEEE